MVSLYDTTGQYKDNGVIPYSGPELNGGVIGWEGKFPGSGWLPG